MSTSQHPGAGPLILTIDGKTPRIDLTARIAPNAVIAGDVVIGPQASIWYGVVLRAEFDTIRIGARTNVQDGVIAHVDPGLPVVVGDGVTVGHQVVLHGCTVGDRALLGMSSTLMNGAVVPAGCLVGAGSLVLASCEAEEEWLIAGSPAKPRRPLTAEELAHTAQGVDSYLVNAAHHPFSDGGAPVQP